MTTIIAFEGQKGGVGKSTLARAVATEAAIEEINVLLVDLNAQQRTTYKWSERRKMNEIKPFFDVVCFDSIGEAKHLFSQYDLVVLDLPGGTNKETLEIAKLANLIIQPTGASADDADPATELFHYLNEKGVDSSKFFYVIYKVDSLAEYKDYREKLLTTGYGVITGTLFEKISYRKASEFGLSITEIPERENSTLRQQAKELIQNIIEKA